MEGSQELNTGTPAEAVKEHCLLASSWRLAHLLFLHSSGPPAIGVAPLTVSWSPLVSIRKQEIARPDGGNFPADGPSTQVMSLHPADSWI